MQPLECRCCGSIDQRASHAFGENEPAGGEIDFKMQLRISFYGTISKASFRSNELFIRFGGLFRWSENCL